MKEDSEALHLDLLETELSQKNLGPLKTYPREGKAETWVLEPFTITECLQKFLNHLFHCTQNCKECLLLQKLYSEKCLSPECL